MAFAALLAFAVPGASARANEGLPSAHLQGSNGYRFDILGYRHRVYVQVVLGHSGLPAASGAVYVTRGVATAKWLIADLEQFGNLGLRFRAQGPSRKRKPPRGCTGRIQIQHGVYHGSFSFQGENGFTVAEAQKLPGTVATDDVRCRAGKVARRPGHHAEHGSHATELEAANSRSVYGTSFSAEEKDGARRATFSALITERFGDLDVYRFAGVSAPESAFNFDFQGPLAAVQPPLPFAGQAQLQPGPGGLPSWSGDLTVALPGASAIPLTGPAFQAALDRVRIGGSGDTISAGHSRSFSGERLGPTVP